MSVTQAPDSGRVPRLSYFFPAHNEAANLEGLVSEALETLPGLADTFEIIAVDDGSKDGTPALADALAAAHPDGVRQFKVADLGRLTSRLAEADQPDVVVGFRIKRADPPLRTLYARAYRLA